MLLSIENLTKYFADRLILDDISITIEDNDRIGLVGVNGAGKTTLLQIIAGEMPFEKGTVSRTNGTAVGYLRQNSGLDSTGTIESEMLSVFSGLIEMEQELRCLEQEIARTNRQDKVLLERYARMQEHFEKLDGYLIEVKIKTVLNGMGFADKPRDSVIGTLSGGEKTRLALAKLLLEQPKLLVLDEPTNHLDFKTLTWLEEYLQGYKGAILAVSHDRYFLDKLATSTWEIERNKLITYKGNYTKFLTLKKEARERLQKEYEAQQEKIAAMEDYIARNIVRATTSTRAKSRVHQLENLERIEKPAGDLKTVRIRFTPKQQPFKEVLLVENMSLSVGSGDTKKQLFEGLDFEVRRGEKIAIVGDNGAGKSSFLKAVQGLIPIQKGDVTWSKNVDIGYYDQEITQLNPEKTVLDELWDRHPTMLEQDVRKVLGSVLLTGENVYKKIDVISGGERARLMFSVLMLQNPNVLILDEPTNHLDLPTKEILEEALLKFDGTVLFISHDRYFLNKIPTKMVELKDGHFDVYQGNYDFYKEKKDQQKLTEGESRQSQLSERLPKAGYRSKQQRSEEVVRRRRIAETEQRMAELEEQIEKIQKEMALPEIFSDYEKAQQLCDLLEAGRKELSEKESLWLELSEE